MARRSTWEKSEMNTSEASDFFYLPSTFVFYRFPVVFYPSSLKVNEVHVVPTVVQIDMDFTPHHWVTST